MNPFNSLVNDRNYETGNPDLDPECTDSYDLGYVNSFENGSFYASAFYRLTTGEIEDIKRIIDDGITLEEPRNLATQEDFGLDTRYTMNLYEWWIMTLSADFYRSEIKGNAGERDLDSETYTMDGEINNQFNIEDLFRLEMEFEYDAPEQEPQEYEQAEYELNMGIRKQLFNNKGNISVSARDLLNTDNNNISNEQGQNWTAQSVNRWSRGPRINVTLSYKLEALDDKVDKTNSNIFGGGE
jgi:outer membrane receptor protein involved in Fe transport